MRYYLIIKEILGNVMVFMTKAKNKESARYLIYSILKESSGRYLGFEITENEYNVNTHNISRIGYYKHIFANKEVAEEEKQTVYLLVSGYINPDFLLKNGIE